MDRDLLKGHLSILAANAIWGLMAPASKMVTNSGQISALSLTGMRILGGALLFWLFSILLPKRILPKESIEKGDWWKLFFASMLITLINQLLVITGVSLTSPVDASVMCSTTPLFTLLVAWFLTGDKPKLLRIVGVLLGFSGMLLFVLNGKADAGRHVSNPWLGNAMCLFSQICAATYFVKFRCLTQKYSPFTLMKWLFLMSSVLMIPISLPSLIATDWSVVETSVALNVVYVVVCGTFLAYILMPIGQRSLRPTSVAMYNYLQPIFAMVFSLLVGLGVMTWSTALATLLIFVGVGLVNRK